MLRGLTFAVALALGTVTVPVHALGLGDIESKSALNQEFNADIDLLSVAAGELDAVRVQLADQTEFDKAGVERPFFLTLLKFSPQRLESGETVIRVSSDFPIREPFLDFLVEVNWPRGRLIREYTVLLDPPVTTGRPAPRVRPAAVKPAPASARAAAPVPPTVVTDGEYGPVAANETLWSIAKRLRPGGASMHQMMMALLESNPGAFIDGDINRLRQGAILRVPPAEQVFSISREQARALYAETQERWLARETERLRDKPQQLPEAAPPAGTPAQAELQAEVDEEAELRIATARPEGEGEAGASEDRGDEDVGQLQEKLLLARENAETSRLESESLRGEIEDMQKRLADMQRLLSLKDEQLAQLQASVGEEVPVAAEEVSLPEVLAPEEAFAEEQLVADETGPMPETLSESGQVEVPTQQPAEPGLESGPAPDLGAELEAEAEALLEQGLEDELLIEAEPDFAQELLPGQGLDSDQGPVPETLDLPLEEIPATAAPDDELVPEDDLFVQPETAVSQPMEADRPEPVPAPEAALDEAQDEAPMEPAAEKPVAVKGPVSDDSLALLEEYGLPAAKLRELLQDRTLLYAGAGALTLIILLLLLLMLRRRRSETIDLTAPSDTSARPDKPAEKESPLAREEAIAASMAATAAATAATTQVTADDGETDELMPDSSFPPVPEGINADVDAVSEADVYIAYGRYGQAEELLKEAMVRDPERLSLKTKLLEVYYATHNKSQYNALAQGMVTAGQDSQDAEAWERICDMGREIDADNPLYDGSHRAVPAEVDLDVDAEGMTDPLDDSLTEDLVDSTLNDIETEEKLLADTVDEPLLDIEDLEQIDDIEALDGASLSLDELASLELDIPGEGGDAGTQQDEAFELSGLADDSLESLELPALDRESALASGEEPGDAEGLKLELDELSSLSALEGDSVQIAEQLDIAEPAGADSDSALDQPIRLDEAFDQEIDSDIEALDIETMGEDFADVGAVGTKLELARAFVEMGDGEGARDILEEVVKEGNENQRHEAEKLLADIA